MLFYNHKQEFIGIDDDGLKLLNYASLEELLKVCSDVADLFAKEPGYIHNFKNFGWIDFLLHADSDAKSAIVNANGRTFSCTLEVQKLHLCAEPAQNGYIIYMTHTVPISEMEPKSPVSAAEPQQPLTSEPPVEQTPAEPLEPAPSVPVDDGHPAPEPQGGPEMAAVPAYGETEMETTLQAAKEEYEQPAPFEAEEKLGETPLPTPPQAQPKPLQPVSGKILFTPAEQQFIDKLRISPSYRFDPNVAANELGLPVDLIEEFIGDFIQQSRDFKNDLFEAIIKADMNTLKILSHKLKGVAANLRIEDAFECLSTINTSNDITEIEANLKYFYGIIDKLERKETLQPQEAALDETVPDTPPAKEAKTAVGEPESQAPDLADDGIYAFSPKEKTDEPSPSVIPETPEIYCTLKDEESEPILLLPEESSASEEAAGTPEEGLPAASAVPQTTEVELHYDRTAVAEQLGIEPSFLDELISDYKQNAQATGKEIADAINAFDTHQWQKTAIQFKGISDNLRLNDISDELAVLSHTNDAQEAHKASKRLTRYLEQL